LISTIVPGIAAVFLAVHLATVLLALWQMSRRPGGGVIPRDARITLLRPICGRDAFDAETLGSSFAQDWPAYDVILCVPSDTDPAVALARELIAANPQVPARLLTGQERITGNPKLDNLWKGWAAATGEYVCMTDSNLLLPPDYLSTLAACWGPRTGLVSSPARGERPDGFAGRLECAFLNGNQGRLQLAAGALGRGFAQGKSLFWNKAMLDAAGGLAPLGKWLAEDVASTRLTRASGREVTLTPRLYAQPIGRRTFRQVWDRQLRWSRVRRDGFPAIFAGEIANGAALPAALLAITAPLWLIPFLVLWFGAEWLLCRRAGWPHGAADMAAAVVRDALLPVLWAATFLKRSITWRGNAMEAPVRGAPTP